MRNGRRGGGMAVGRFIDREALMRPVVAQTAAAAEVDIMRVFEGCTGDVEIERHGTHPHTESGAKALMVAVMEQAYRDLHLQDAVQHEPELTRKGRQSMNARQRHAIEFRQTARGWFESDDESWSYSFVNICLTLGWEPDYVRSLALHGVPASVYPVTRAYRSHKSTPIRRWQNGASHHRVVAPRVRTYARA